MNVYVIEDGGGVTVFDAGIAAMGTALRAACARMGGVRRVVLGHADCDHRGAAPALAAPTYCHPAERDEVAGFRVVALPGHAPGLIGLYRDSDRLALVSDRFDTLDPQTGRKDAPRVPHPAFDADVEQARASIRKLAAATL